MDRKFPLTPDEKIFLDHLFNEQLLKRAGPAIAWLRNNDVRVGEMVPLEKIREVYFERLMTLTKDELSGEPDAKGGHLRPFVVPWKSVDELRRRSREAAEFLGVQDYSHVQPPQTRQG
jgi:hypothetical protein